MFYYVTVLWPLSGKYYEVIVIVIITCNLLNNNLSVILICLHEPIDPLEETKVYSL